MNPIYTEKVRNSASDASIKLESLVNYLSDTKTYFENLIEVSETYKGYNGELCADKGNGGIAVSSYFDKETNTKVTTTTEYRFNIELSGVDEFISDYDTICAVLGELQGIIDEVKGIVDSIMGDMDIVEEEMIALQNALSPEERQAAMVAAGWVTSKRESLNTEVSGITDSNLKYWDKPIVFGEEENGYRVAYEVQEDGSKVAMGYIPKEQVNNYISIVSGNNKSKTDANDELWNRGSGPSSDNKDVKKGSNENGKITVHTSESGHVYGGGNGRKLGESVSQNNKGKISANDALWERGSSSSSQGVSKVSGAVASIAANDALWERGSNPSSKVSGGTTGIPSTKISNALEEYRTEYDNAKYKYTDNSTYVTVSDKKIGSDSVTVTHIVMDNNGNQINIEQANGAYKNGAETPAQAYERLKSEGKKPLVVINGSNFNNNSESEWYGTQDLESNKASNLNHLTIANNKLVDRQSGNGDISDPSSVTAGGAEFCLNSDGTFFRPTAGTSAQQLIDSGTKGSLSIHETPLVVPGSDGKGYVSSTVDDPSQSGYYTRNVLGQTANGDIYVVTGTTDKRQVAEYMANELNCTIASSMDQGGSVGIIVDGKNIFENDTENRPVGDFVVISSGD